MNERIDICAICLEQLNIPSPNLCVTECNHVFHLNCFLHNREYNVLCPICRANVPMNIQEVRNDIPELIDEANRIDNDEPELEGNFNNIHTLFNNLGMDAFDFFENIIAGTQINEEIQNIVNFAYNNDISNQEYNNRDTIVAIRNQILNLITLFAQSSINYLVSIQHNNSVINLNNNINYYIIEYNAFNAINDIIYEAINNNIRNNITYQTMENNINSLCKQFTMFLLSNNLFIRDV